MWERTIVPRENMMPRTHDLGGLKTSSESRDQEWNLQILGILKQQIHEEQIEQRGTVARAEWDREIHEDQKRAARWVTEPVFPLQRIGGETESYIE
jgi:hypothetical protein